MRDDWLSGYVLVFVAGALQGSFMLPMKFARRWRWENTWLIFSCTAYFIWPWLFALLTLPHILKVFESTSTRCLALILIFGVAWGFGALTCGIGIDLLGMALGFAIIIGIATAVGTLVPLIVLSPDTMVEPQGLLAIAGVGLMLFGVATCCWAGKMRDGAQPRTGQLRSSYSLGIAVSALSGLLSGCGNFGLAFGGEIVERSRALGAAESTSAIALWVVMTIPLFLINVIYSVWLLRKHRSGSLFVQSRVGSHWLLGALMGALWIAGLMFYSAGAYRLGPLGVSVGWGILMSLLVITANLWGFVTGEWKGAGGRSISFLLVGIGLLILSVLVVGYANFIRVVTTSISETIVSVDEAKTWGLETACLTTASSVRDK